MSKCDCGNQSVMYNYGKHLCQACYQIIADIPENHPDVIEGLKARRYWMTESGHSTEEIDKWCDHKFWPVLLSYELETIEGMEELKRLNLDLKNL